MGARSFGVPDRSIDQVLSLAQEGVEVLRSFEALRVDLVDALGARRAGSEPSAGGHDFEPVDGSSVARSAGQLGRDGLAGERLFADGFGRERLESLLFLGGSRRVDARVVRGAEFRLQRLVVLARILAGRRGDLRGQKTHEDAVLVGRPDSGVAPQETGAGALFTPETA